MFLADSHCHILDPRLVERAEEIVARLDEDGLEFIVEISASPQESYDALEFAGKHEKVYCTLGVHPHVADQYSDEFERWVLSLCEKLPSPTATPPLQKGDLWKKKVVAVGECGLDYYYMTQPKELQKQIFARQIMLADRMKLPLVVHMRDAFDDMMDILIDHKAYLKNGLLFHCYSEGASEITRIREHFDAYFAFGGAITYKGAAKSQDAIRAVPLDRIMVETDAPYLTPTPLRGKVNEPKNVRYVAEHVAGVLGLPFEEVSRATLENTRRFFKV